MADKVLIVDDSVSMRQMESLILKAGGYEVVEAANGKEGVARLTDDIKVVITDYNMPEMNGIEFIEAVRGGTVNRSVPILMVTTESEAEKKQEGKRAGATGWLTKPFEQDQLLRAIRKVAAPADF
ncbi:MAG: response regulator [Spirochaetaceae bacterium]|nr:MAG: response regulator [Spirochaetaceae bacterium]